VGKIVGSKGEDGGMIIIHLLSLYSSSQYNEWDNRVESESSKLSHSNHKGRQKQRSEQCKRGGNEEEQRELALSLLFVPFHTLC